MRVLVLGGTRFVGRHIVEAMVAGGHAVSVLNRGVSADALGAGVERLRGDRDLGGAGLRALEGREWDACIDVSGYTGVQVRASVEMLRGRVGRYVFVSAVSVYGDPKERPVREGHARVAPAEESVTEVVGEMYGRLKVTCENIVEEVYGARGTVLRPQIVVGPHDPSGRYSYWLRRGEVDGPVLAPGDGTDHVQVIDARDVARFSVRVVEDELSGPFNLAGPRMMWREFVALMGVREPVWVAEGVIRGAGVGEAELPLFRAERGTRSGLMDVSSERAIAAGLVLTGPRETARDARGADDGDCAGMLTREREGELIAAVREGEAELPR